MKTLEQLTVGVLSHNTADRLQICLASFRKWMPGCRTIVFDNGSTDDSPGIVRRNYPEMELVVSNINLFFPAGCNQIVRMADTEYVLLMNADVFLEDDNIPQLINFMTEHPELVCVAPAVRDAGRLRHMSHDTLTPALIAARDSFPGKVLRQTAWYRKAMYEDKPPDAVFFAKKITNACCIIRKNAFLELGGFHTGQLLYWTEEDFAIRVAARGLRQAVFGRCIVGHQHGSSTATLPPSLLRAIIVHDRVAYVRRNYGTIAMLMVETVVCLRLKIWRSVNNLWCYLKHKNTIGQTLKNIQLHAGKED